MSQTFRADFLSANHAEAADILQALIASLTAALEMAGGQPPGEGERADMRALRSPTKLLEEALTLVGQDADGAMRGYAQELNRALHISRRVDAHVRARLSHGAPPSNRAA